MSTSAFLFFFLLALHFVHNSLVTHELLLSVKTFKIILTFFEASLQLSYLTLWCDNLFSELVLRSIQTRGGTNENNLVRQLLEEQGTGSHVVGTRKNLYLTSLEIHPKAVAATHCPTNTHSTRHRSLLSSIKKRKTACYRSTEIGCCLSTRFLVRK